MEEKKSPDPIRAVLIAVISFVQYFLFVLMTLLSGRDYLRSTREYAAG